MKMLLDENLPKRLKQDFSAYEIHTIRDMGWQGKKNGELLVLMMANGFDLLLTFDKNIRHQLNFAKFPVSVFLLIAPGNDYLTMKPLAKKVIQLIEADSISTGVTEISL